MTGRIVVTGPTGNTGQEVLKALAERKLDVVGMVRSDANAQKLQALGVGTVRGDFSDQESLVRALEGAEKAYLVCTPDERLVSHETAFIEAAARAGVKHIVKCSAYLADAASDSPNLRAHAEIERVLAASGLAWTVLRPTGFMQTFTLVSWDLMMKAGVITFPHDDAAIPLVDLRDVAQAAVKALTEPGHEGKVYDLTGPEPLTGYRQAEVLGKVLERTITYLPGKPRELERMLDLMGVKPAAKEHALVVTRMLREGKLAQVHPTLEEIGIEPTSYEAFVRDVVSGRTGGGNSFQPPDTMAFRVLSAVMPLFFRLRVAFRGRGPERAP